MKKKNINKYRIPGWMLLLAFACKQPADIKGHEHHAHTAMRSVVADTGISHLIRPVNEEVLSKVQVLTPAKTTKAITVKVQGVVGYDTRENTSLSARVGGRIEKLYVKYNYQPVQKGQLVLTIYSPDLVAAQRELILLVRTNGEDQLVQSARQRLRLLGITEAQIETIARSGNPVYSIPIYANASGYILEQSAPANSAIATREGQYVTAGQTLFTIYTNQALVADFSFSPAQAASIAKGKELSYYPSSNPNLSYTGKIGLVRPVLGSGQNFTQARVYQVPRNLKPGQQLTAEMTIVTGSHYWLPQEAVLDMGNHQMVLFKKEGPVFTPVYIQTGIKADRQIEVLDEIGNWQVAANAYYLVDSEGFIPQTQKQTP